MKAKRAVSLSGKAILSLLVAVLMLGSLLVGCANNTDTESPDAAPGDAETEVSSPESASTGDVIELSFWTLSTRQDGYDAVTEAFNNSQDGIHVTVSYYDTDGMKDACKVGAASETLPDMWFNWGGSLGQYYVDNGCTYDLTAYAEANNWADKFNGGAISLCTLGGQLSGYPTQLCVMGMFYKKSTFEQYNIEVPATFEDLENACATLKENGVTPFSTAGLYGWHVMRFLEQAIEYYADVDLHDDLQAMSTSWEDDSVISALSKYQEWCDKGYFPEGFLTNDPNDTFLALATGTCAMDLQGQWYDGTIASNEQNVEDYGWFPFPNGTGRMSAFAEMAQLNANLSDEQIEACIQYLNFLFTNENAAAYPESISVALNDAVYPEDTPHVKEMYEYASANGTFTITDQAFPTEVADVLFSNQEALYSGTTTPEAAAADIQAAIENYLASN